METRRLDLAFLCVIYFSLSAFHLPFASVAAQPTDRGFIHPGGLHTQADFDRVKAQLEAGNPKVKQAYAKLTSAAYAQANVQTSPTETIVRGGSGENYMNAARGATAAYQNALRWKIEGKKANADAAVRIMMAWARTTKAIGGDSNQFLASGIYGYPFAQAAELMRDYEGWSPEDKEEYKRWMMNVWYPKAIDFLRRRNGSWENSGKWWQAPGHYWSNWSLANVLTVMSIGILCDDVFIYNQGVSFFKYDQVGTYAEPPVLHEVTGHEGYNGQMAIWNDGLTDFLGNCVVTCVESDLETGAYGCLGQMNESGRDGGHCALALGLAVDVAKVGWHQGDDLFAYMDHRLAAGIEYVAAQTQGVEGLPWTNYLYYTNGFAYTDGRSQLLTAPALPAQMRPYWGTVIGIYEGVKGVRMPFAEKAYEEMGIDEGAQGSTSGGYDHMGYSVLMNTRDPQISPAEQVPTELMPLMEYSGTLTTSLIPSLVNEKARGLINGKTLHHNELGGLVNTYKVNNSTCLPAGETVHLVPQLPDGEEDTGRWQWNTGETTRDITISTDRSYIYRVTYTNSRGVESQLAFTIAATGDCLADELTPKVTVAGGETIETTTVEVLYGKSVTLGVQPSRGWGTYKWSTGATTETITKTVTADTEYTVEFKNQGGAVTTMTFNVHMVPALPYVSIGSGEAMEDITQAVATAGETVTLGLTLPSAVRPANVVWNDGSTGATHVIEDVETSTTCTATFTLRGQEYTITFDVLVPDDEATAIDAGQYLIRHIATDTYLTAHEKNQAATFEPRNEEANDQLWYIDHDSRPRYNLVSLAAEDSLYLAISGKVVITAYFPFFIQQARESERVALRTGSTASTYKFWDVVADGTINLSASTKLTAFPFELLRVDQADGIRLTPQPPLLQRGGEAGAVYDLLGHRVSDSSSVTRHSSFLKKGVYIVNARKVAIR